MKLIKRCFWIFNHNWRDTREPIIEMKPSEQWYWVLQRCKKCKQERIVFKDFFKTYE